MEYASNILSLDPDNLFKSKSEVKFFTDYELFVVLLMMIILI